MHLARYSREGRVGLVATRLGLAPALPPAGDESWRQAKHLARGAIALNEASLWHAAQTRTFIDTALAASVPA